MWPVFAKALHLTLTQFGSDPKVVAAPFLMEIKGVRKRVSHKFSTASYRYCLPVVTEMSCLKLPE